MMISMHANMRDTYHLYTNISNSVLFLSSIFLNAFVFFDSQIFSSLNVPENLGQFVIVISSILIFFSSILIMVFSWEEKSQKHELAKNELYELLEEVRSLLQIQNISDQTIDIFEKKKVKIFSRLISIPEKKFRKLKHKHYQKVALSKFIDKNHNLPYPIIVIKFWFNK